MTYTPTRETLELAALVCGKTLYLPECRWWQPHLHAALMEDVGGLEGGCYDREACTDWNAVALGTDVIYGASAEGKFVGYSPDNDTLFILTDHTKNAGKFVQDNGIVFKGYRAVRERRSFEVKLKETPPC